MRRFLWLSLGVLLLAGIAVASSGGATQAEARWAITDLGVPPKFKRSEAIAVNERGQVVIQACPTTGTCPSPPGAHLLRAFLWDRGRIIDLGTLGGSGSRPTAISDSGQIVGTSLTKNGESHAFVWEESKMRDLGTLGGSHSFASAINERGLIVGWSLTQNGERHACLWRGAKIHDLGTLQGTKSKALSVNDRGQIVGVSETAARDEIGDPQVHAFLWEKGTMRDLGVMAPEAIDINERGQIVWEDPNYAGVLWQEGRKRKLPLSPTQISDLGWVIGIGELYGAVWRNRRLIELDFVPVAINDRGMIAGWKWAPHGPRSKLAFVWENGKSTSLPTLSAEPSISAARALNSRGAIVGTSKYRAVVWTLKR